MTVPERAPSPIEAYPTDLVSAGKALGGALLRIGPAPFVLLLALLVPMPVEGGRSLGGLPNLCPFHSLTGQPCPGCGITRSIVCLAHGHFSEAVYYHPLGPIAFAVLIAATLSRLPMSPRLRAALTSPTAERLKIIGGVLAILLLLAVWGARLMGWLPKPP